VVVGEELAECNRTDNAVLTESEDVSICFSACADSAAFIEVFTELGQETEPSARADDNVGSEENDTATEALGKDGTCIAEVKGASLQFISAELSGTCVTGVTGVRNALADLLAIVTEALDETTDEDVTSLNV